MGFIWWKGGRTGLRERKGSCYLRPSTRDCPHKLLVPTLSPPKGTRERAPRRPKSRRVDEHWSHVRAVCAKSGLQTNKWTRPKHTRRDTIRPTRHARRDTTHPTRRDTPDDTRHARRDTNPFTSNRTKGRRYGRAKYGIIPDLSFVKGARRTLIAGFTSRGASGARGKVDTTLSLPPFTQFHTPISHFTVFFQRLPE